MYAIELCVGGKMRTAGCEPQMRAQRTLVCRCSVLVCGLWCCLPVQGQSVSEYPRTPWGGYAYATSYDAEIADPDVHRVLFENQNIILLEVSNPPELDVKMHGHPYPSVFARDTGAGPSTAGIPLEETHLDPTSPFAGKGWGQGPSPSGLQFPRCTTAPPEAPHKPINHGTVPVHFYRIEFRRLDGEDFRTHWKDWYPWMLNPRKPSPSAQPGFTPESTLSDAWPYPMNYAAGLSGPTIEREGLEEWSLLLYGRGRSAGTILSMHSSRR
jgi:hypothetical protein